MRPWSSHRPHPQSFHQTVGFKPGLAALSIGLALCAAATLQLPEKRRTPSAALVAPDFHTNVRHTPISFIENQG